MPSTKEQIRDMWQRRRQAYELIDRERRRALARMTPEQSLAIFNDLCALWRPLPASDQRALDRCRLRSRIKVRRAFRTLAENSRNEQTHRRGH